MLNAMFGTRCFLSVKFTRPAALRPAHPLSIDYVMRASRTELTDSKLRRLFKIDKHTDVGKITWTMIVVIDNYDSFTYNLVQRLGEIDENLRIEVFRNDQVSCEAIADLSPTHLIVSPGPCTPKEAGISVECVETFTGKLPILGVCLGHQSIGQATGGTIVSAKHLMHGKTDQIFHDGRGLFSGLPNPFIATRYHSLVIDPDTLCDDLEVTAWADAPTGEREIMAVRHRQHPLEGWQFHPESFLTEVGPALLSRFLELRVG